MAPRPSAAGDDARLGAAIRSRRLEASLTLKQLAADTGLSHPFLSQVERALAQPSMSSLHRIAGALDTTAQALLAGSARATEPEIVRSADSTSWRITDRGPQDGTVRLLAHADRPFHVLEFDGAPSDLRDYWRHDGHELLYVIKGSIEVDLAGDTFTLREGDSAAYDAALPHRFRRTGRSTPRVLLVETAHEGAPLPARASHRPRSPRRGRR